VSDSSSSWTSKVQQLRGAAAPVEIDRAWVEARLHKVNELLARDPTGARREIQKHIEDLGIAPAPELGERVFRITRRRQIDSLLGGEETVRLQLIRFHRAPTRASTIRRS